MYFAINRKASPEALAIFGVLAILLSGFIGFLSVRELAVLPSEPQHMSISEALSKISEKPLWVILDDIQWDCDHVYYLKGYKSGDTYIVFTSKDKSVLGLALFGGKTDCRSVTQNKVAGVLDVDVPAKNSDIYELLTESGFDIDLHERSGTFLSLCTYCGIENSLTGAIVSIIFFILGIFLFVPLMKETKAQKNAQRFMKRNILKR